MKDTITGKIRLCGIQTVRGNLEILRQVEVLDENRQQFILRVMDSFMYGNKKLGLNSIASFFKYDKDLFDEDLLQLINSKEEKTSANAEVKK